MPSCHSAAPRLSYYSMRYHPYLAHRAAKRPRVTRVELRLLDRDLADAGVQIPWTAFVRTDDRTRLLVKRTMLDILDAA